jgi:hypothetical protein
MSLTDLVFEENGIISLTHKASYKRGHGHGHQIWNFVLTSVIKIEFFKIAVTYRGTRTTLGKNNNSVSKSPDGKSLRSSLLPFA